MATKEKLSKQRKGTAKYPHIDDILSGGARSDEDTATVSVPSTAPNLNHFSVEFRIQIRV